MPKDPNPTTNNLSAYCQDINLKRIAKQVIENPMYLTFSIYSNLQIQSYNYIKYLI